MSGRDQRIKRRSEPDVVVPTDERCAQGSVERIEKTIADVDGRSSLPWRTLDTLARMERGGSITEAMRQAGDRFHDSFQVAGLEALHAADPTRIPVQLASNSRVIRLHDGGSEGARRSVIRALQALGGILSPSGSCAWHVLGLEETLERWASTRGWADRRITRDTAGGILIGGLGMLRKHYGL